MKQYHDLVKHVLENGNQKGDRTGTGTKSVFKSENTQIRYLLMMWEKIHFVLVQC